MRSVLFHSRVSLGLLLVLATGFGLFAAYVPVAHAATITVTTTADELAADGNCSLREAIIAANTDTTVDACPAGNGADTVNVPAGTYTLSIPPNNFDITTGDFNIVGDVTLSGAGLAKTIFDGNHLDRLIDVELGATATIKQITIQNGDARYGAAQGGGIRNYGTLVLQRSTVQGNIAFDRRDGYGGGIANRGQATIIDSDVRGNGAFIGGGIDNGPDSVLRITNTTISGNGAADGGGIANSGSMDIANSIISGNAVGGTCFADSCYGGTGGGISNNGALHLVNTTITGNTASTPDAENPETILSGGAGISNGQTVTMNNVTITANTSDGGNGGILSSSFGSTVTFGNTIISGNTASRGTTPDCAGTFTSFGYNLIGNPTGCTLTGDPTGNLVGVDPRLGPLADNGGPTFTHALLPGSPALDAANPQAPGSGGNACADTDQRGVTRPQDGNDDGTARCDIGAYERAGAGAATPTPYEGDEHAATPTTTSTTAPTATSAPTIHPEVSATSGAGRLEGGPFTVYLPLLQR